MRVYGYIKLDSQGFGDGTETRIMVYDNQQDAIDMAYESYLKETSFAYNEGYIEESDIEEKESFESDFINGLAAGLVQYPDWHVQYEYFEKEVHEHE